ncbi:MAG TPA: beta-ketoacyl-[acyl-carrier-protein] synthase family protein [Bacteroidales bacterium]|nr:beta-ketoacyl-[acyl-carrier-protein] synthase family protein [Bacteroidales bacterium]HPL03988.1 beta-ketoacyl-[acyl-carrier-protein] synthase family protein [Bacteroidales bacterium]
MNKRVVITGLGVISPIGNDIESFTLSMRKGISGIKYIKELADYNFASQIGGVPDINNSEYEKIFEKFELNEADLTVKYSVLAALQAWGDAKLELPDRFSKNINEDYGAVIGSCAGGIELYTRKLYPMVSSKNVRKLGSQIIKNLMHSSTTSILSNIFALANQTISNSSACATGVESIIMATEKIKQSKANLFIVGSADPYSPYMWAGFDSMRLLARKFNDKPTQASRPLSASSSGFVAAAGAGMMIIEELEHALSRNAKIYAEIVGYEYNSGGQRNTASNPKRVIDCIKTALNIANISGKDIDLICGYLTGSQFDSREVANWKTALNLDKTYPYINSLKSLTGHTIGASGSIETIAAVLQLKNNFIHPSINCEDLNPDIKSTWDKNKIPQKLIKDINLNYIAKASFGFGDVNSCIILKKFN